MIVACPDENAPKVDVIEITETIEEAQETMQYRNHLPSRPRLPMPPKPNIICSPTEVKFHRRVELKDHNASEDTKKHFEELFQQFPEVFLTMKILAEPSSLTWILTQVMAPHPQRNLTLYHSSIMIGFSKRARV